MFVVSNVGISLKMESFNDNIYLLTINKFDVCREQCWDRLKDIESDPKSIPPDLLVMGGLL